jgi:diguanylate cyclase (GGDEF)-like protein/PAS domain S-box-containing protein
MKTINHDAAPANPETSMNLPPLSGLLPNQSEVLQLLLDNIGDQAIFMVDARGFVRSWNAGAERLKGYSSREVSGRHFAMFFCEPDRLAGEPDRLLRLAAENGRHEFETWRLHKDGSRFWAQVAVAPIQDPNGGLTGFAVTTRAGTEQRRSGESGDRARELLERRVQERTRELMEINNELKRLATTDPLTGVMNRRAFLECCAQEVERSKRYRRPLSMLYIDLDGFKLINDGYGHQAGDDVLRRVATEISAHLRNGDIFARFGGDEFVALLTETGPDEAVTVAGRVCAALRGLSIDTSGATLHTGASFGITQLQPRDNVEDLLARADGALYVAKHSSRHIALADD